MAAKKRFIFLLSHPIQYFSPLFQLMAKDPDIDLLVLYCSDENVKGHVDKDFGVEVKWDIPLLEGYNYKFLKNNSWKPSLYNGFFGLMNFEIFNELKNEKGSFLVVQGWNNFTNNLGILFGKLFGVKVCIRGDNPHSHEVLKNKVLLFIKRILLGKLLFRFIDYFLYVGKQNKQFYVYYGVPDNKLIFTPHAVDNDRFNAEYKNFKDSKTELRKELGLPVDKKIILTSGKYITKKRPMDLLYAYHSLNNENTALVFLGDGELRNEMETYIRRYNLNDVYLTGFKNQSEVGKYFSAADIFVLPSGMGETWGLAVNEAMNFSLPIILSEIVGCGDDLIQNGINGYKYKSNDLNELVDMICLLVMDENKRLNFGNKSKIIVEDYDFYKIINQLNLLSN